MKTKEKPYRIEIRQRENGWEVITVYSTIADKHYVFNSIHRLLMFVEKTFGK